MQLMGNWMEEGWNKGLLQGEQKGRREEAERLMLRQLPRRVGPLTKKLEKQVCALLTEQLEALAEALFDFQSRADLEAWLGALK